MKKFYIIYAVLSVVLIVLKIFGIVSWWVATSFIWFPLGVVLTLSLVLAVTVDYGARVRKRKEEQFKPTCENCLWGSLKETLKKEQCEGQEKGMEMHDGICDSYIRDRTK